MIDPKEGLAAGLERLLAGSARVIQVRTPQEAARVLQGHEIAVIVADLSAKELRTQVAAALRRYATKRCAGVVGT